jgi:hypothetical protein
MMITENISPTRTWLLSVRGPKMVTTTTTTAVHPSNPLTHQSTLQADSNRQK